MSVPLLALDAVTVALGNRRVLDGVSLDIHAGELLGVIGPNGAGKTTLLRTVAGLERPSAGRILLAGADARSLPRRTLARQIALAPQDADATWAATVREYVALGRAPYRGWFWPLGAGDRAAIDDALTRLGLTELADRPMPTLSGGESQRARLARTVVQSPQVLLLDEPTTHLDPKFQAEFLEAVRLTARARRIAVAVTLHDLNLAGVYADRVACLKAGRLLAIGDARDVLTGPQLAELYDTPFAVAPHPLTGTPAVTLDRNRHRLNEPEA